MRALLIASVICVMRCAVPAQELDRAAIRLDVVEHGRDISARMKAMEESLAVGTSSERTRLVAALLRMSEGMDEATIEHLPREDARQRRDARTLLEQFLRTAPQRFASDPDARRDLVQFAEALLAKDARLVAGDLARDAFDVMIANCASTEEVRAKVMDCVVRDHGWLWYHVEWRLRTNGQLDEDLIARVRPIVRRALERDALNRTALRLVSECGDAAILPDLQEAISRARLSPDDLYAARQAVWKIEIQNPPRRLIEFLENARQDHWAILDHDGTAWIVRKAVERGLPREDIQRAARQYYANCEPETLRRMRVLGLDRRLIDLGILKEADLPDRDWLNVRPFER